MEQFHLYISGVRIRDRPQWCGLGKKQNEKIQTLDAAISQRRSIFQLKWEPIAFRNADEAVLLQAALHPKTHSQPSCVLTTPAWPAEQVTEPPGN